MPNDVRELVERAKKAASNTVLKVDQAVMRELATALEALQGELERVKAERADELADRVRQKANEIAQVVPEWSGDDPVRMFMSAVEAELRRARAKFPGDRIMTIALAEEFGELAKAMLDESGESVWKEAVQTAVMAARVAIDGDSSVDEWRTAKGLDNHRNGARALLQTAQPALGSPEYRDAVNKTGREPAQTQETK